MAKQTFINTKRDMRWLRHTHCPGHKAKSAIIHGNEDYPEKVELFSKRNPKISDKPIVCRPKK